VPNEAYRLVVTKTARKELLALPPKISRQVERTVDRIMARLRQGERPQDMKKLQGRAGAYRVDSGEYRILLELDEDASLITVFRVRHRRDVYRNL
jgi:mRNA interferase RelE/StbE